MEYPKNPIIVEKMCFGLVWSANWNVNAFQKLAYATEMVCKQFASVFTLGWCHLGRFSGDLSSEAAFSMIFYAEFLQKYVFFMSLPNRCGRFTPFVPEPYQ